MHPAETTADGVAESRGTFHMEITIISKEIVRDAARSTVIDLKYPPVVHWKDADRKIIQEGNIVGSPPY